MAVPEFLFLLAVYPEHYLLVCRTGLRSGSIPRSDPTDPAPELGGLAAHNLLLFANSLSRKIEKPYLHTESQPTAEPPPTLCYALPFPHLREVVTLFHDNN
jgi:hypothetical protein